VGRKGDTLMNKPPFSYEQLLEEVFKALKEYGIIK